jgi:hypothetical protein
MDRTSIMRALLFTGAAAGPAMLIVLVLRLAGYLDSVSALLDLVVLLVVGVLSTLLVRILGRGP